MRVQDDCENDNKAFCMIWSTAGYFGELGIGFGAVSCLAILFGVTTHSRRRRIWKSVSVLVLFHGAFIASTGPVRLIYLPSPLNSQFYPKSSRLAS